MRSLQCVKVLVTIALCASLGCQTAVSAGIDKSNLRSVGAPADMEIYLLSEAKDVRNQAVNQVGRHTISFFMIPGPRVTTIREPLVDAVANNTRRAVEVAGYRVQMVDKLREADAPVLVVQIDDLRNYNFTWIYPLGICWGKMEVSLHLMSPQGETLWTANTRGHGGFMASLLYMSGFGTRVKSDMEHNMNQVIEIVSSAEFKNQLVR